ncbi:MAG: hypothetical protein J5956_10065 [Ruminococcus sp.]|nr:hypothetical protein [Ruminococcus sp.]
MIRVILIAFAVAVLAIIGLYIAGSDKWQEEVKDDLKGIFGVAAVAVIIALIIK